MSLIERSIAELPEDSFNTSTHETAPIIGGGRWEPEVIDYWVEKARTLHGDSEAQRTRIIMEHFNANQDNRVTQAHSLARTVMHKLIG